MGAVQPHRLMRAQPRTAVLYGAAVRVSIGASRALRLPASGARETRAWMTDHESLQGINDPLYLNMPLCVTYHRKIYRSNTALRASPYPPPG